MKNSQKGFVVPLLIVIAVLVIGGGVYLYAKRNQSSQNLNTHTSGDTIIAGMDFFDVLKGWINSGQSADICAKVTYIPGDLLWSSSDAKPIDACYRSFAEARKDLSICSKIQDYNIQQYCKDDVSAAVASSTKPTLQNKTNSASTQSNVSKTPPAPPVIPAKPSTVTTSTLPAKTIIQNAVNNQSAMNKFRAMYSGTETASDGTRNQTISFWSQEDKQDTRTRYALYRGVVYQKDSVSKGYFGSIAETMYHFTNPSSDISVSCVNTSQSCQPVGNSFAEYFARATASRGLEMQSLLKLFGLNVYGEPNLMNITNAGAKSVTYDSSISGQPATKSSTCDMLNIVFSPTEVKKLASPSGQVSFTTIDPSQSKFNVNLCIDRTTGLIDQYSTDRAIVTTDGQNEKSTSNGTLLGYSTETIFTDQFPFPTNVEQYNH